MSDAPSEEKAAVAVAYVHQNECTMSFHHSFVNLLHFDLGKHGRVMRGGFIAINSGTNGLVESRNMAVSIFLDEKKDAEWFFWLDTDMGFFPDVVERLVEAADPIERPIVGALCYSIRQMGADDMGGHRTKLTPTIFDWTTEEDGHKGFAVRFNYTRNALTRCNGTGSACIVIHRSVFEKIKEKHGAVWYDRIVNPTTGQLIGEDLSFCMRAGLEGYPIFVHTGVLASHAKTQWLIETDYDDQLMAEAMRLSMEKPSESTAVIVPVLGRPQNAAPFMESLKASTDKATVYAIVGPDKQAGKIAVAWTKAGAQVRVCQGNTFAEKVNHGYRITTEPWLLLVGDDVRFHPGWLEAAQKVGAMADVVGTNDLANPRVLKGEHTCHPLIKRSYIDEVGASWDGPGVVCHTYGHWYVDDEIVTAAKQRGVWGFAREAVIEHLHPLFGKGKEDEVYRLGWSKAAVDGDEFKARLRKYMPEMVPA